ncbi:MAG: hypothetical protein GY865_08885 [candidate division Zixibacteria bacterium]|nr:hypothetical protein [candidate division Zixibacteria bacterium]
MKRLIFLLAFFTTLLVFISCVSSIAQNIDSSKFETVRFAVIGDRSGGASPGVYEQVVKEIERMKPDFVITVGDMIEGPENNEERLRNKWTEYLSIVSQLSMPIYYAPGNNDIEMDFMESFYIEYIGQPYHSFDFEGIHIIVIDNSRWSSSDELPQKQIDWIENDLENNAKAKQCIVFYHKPFWETSTADNEPDKLHTLFQTYGVDALFSGHYHKYFSGKYDDILYTNVGSSGGSMNPGPTGLEYHFVWVTVDDKKISIAPIKMGAVLPWDEVTADENKFITKAQSNSISFSQPYIVAESQFSNVASFEVTIKNSSKEFWLEDTLQWDVPTTWFVEPLSKPVSIAPDSSQLFKFNIKCMKPLYPLPSLTINFPYGKDKTASVVEQLPIARQTICHKTDIGPTLDGNISEKSWNNPETNFLGYDGDPTETDSVRFYFAYDKNNLYLASYCNDSDIKSIMTGVAEHDGAVYGDDCVGYILQPEPEKEEMYLVYVNPNGFIFDQKMTIGTSGYYESDESWNCEYEVKTKIGKDFWCVELQLSLQQFGTKIDKDNFWGLNFRRKQPQLNDAAHWQIPWRYGPDFLGRMIME